MQHWGALYYYLFLNPQLYKIQVLYNCGKETTATAAEKRPPLSAISPLRPFFCALSFRLSNARWAAAICYIILCCTVRQQKNYLLYLYLHLYLLYLFDPIELKSIIKINIKT